jgi:regulator of replication initiation timing
MYEHALRQVQNDPQVAEDRVVVAKMADLLAAHVDNESICGAATAKMEQAHKAIEELKGQLRIVEARNVKLSAQNSKLNEQVREANNLLTEATKVERKERASKVKNASGRGQRVADQVIAEYAATPKDDKKGQELTEGSDPLSDLLVLSGLEER